MAADILYPLILLRETVYFFFLLPGELPGCAHGKPRSRSFALLRDRTDINLAFSKCLVNLESWSTGEGKETWATHRDISQAGGWHFQVNPSLLHPATSCSLVRGPQSIARAGWTVPMACGEKKQLESNPLLTNCLGTPSPAADSAIPFLCLAW